MKPGRRTAGRLWSSAVRPDDFMLQYAVGEDRHWDTRLLPWDILGSLGHIEGLRVSGLLSEREFRKLRAGLRGALRAARAEKMPIGPAHEDAHSAIEDWLTRRLGPTGGRVHTGRSRNDQVACALRLYTKDRLLELHHGAIDLCEVLLAFARRYRTALWPGYTHQRRAMASSAGAWAAGLAEGVLASAESLPALWARVDRSPLGTAAGYGVPLPLRREAAMRALGFRGLDLVVTATQLGRGKLEAAVLFWCVDLGHDLSRLATDAVALTGEEFGFLVLPPDLSTGSSIMPHKRNPDLFEMTRARAAALEGDLAAALAIKGKLGGGYHRDFQLLKEPLFRGLDRTGEMLALLARAVPRLAVDRDRARDALHGDAMVTDEVMRRVESEKRPFRQAYRDVADEHRAGVVFPEPSQATILAHRRSTGGLGNLPIGALAARARSARRWNRRERKRFETAMTRLAGRGGR